MSLTLSETDLAQLEHALGTILMPMAHDDVNQWAESVMTACQPLFQADHTLFGHAFAGSYTLLGQGARFDEAVQSYVHEYYQHDPGMTVRRPALGLTIYHRDMVYDRDELPRTLLYHEWCVPNRLLDKIGIAGDGVLTGVPCALQAAGLPPLLHFFRDRDGTLSDASRRLKLLALIRPSLMSALRTIGQFDQNRAHLLDYFDRAPVSVALFSGDGQQLYENPAFHTLVPLGDQRREILDLASSIARRLRSSVPRSNTTKGTESNGAKRRVPATHRRPKKHDAGFAPGAPWSVYHASHGVYRLHGSVLPDGLLAPEEVIAFCIERVVPIAMSDVTLRNEFRLTTREIEVARLIAKGLGNREIASTLAISYNTARRHSEMLLLKLSASDRGAAGAMLRGETSPRPGAR